VAAHADDMVVKMLDLAQLAPGERLVDLGSGDAGSRSAAAKRARSPRASNTTRDVAHSRRLAAEARVDVELVQGDIFASDFSRADVVTMFLLDTLNERFGDAAGMKPGTRVVSYRFGMGEWEPDVTIDGGAYDAYLWRVSRKVEGEWKVVIANHPADAAHRAAIPETRGAGRVGERAARCAMRRFAARS